MKEYQVTYYTMSGGTAVVTVKALTAQLARLMVQELDDCDIVVGVAEVNDGRRYC